MVNEVKQLACCKSKTLTLVLPANELSVSPVCTTYSTQLGGVVGQPDAGGGVGVGGSGVDVTTITTGVAVNVGGSATGVSVLVGGGTGVGGSRVVVGVSDGGGGMDVKVGVAVAGVVVVAIAGGLCWLIGVASSSEGWLCIARKIAAITVKMTTISVPTPMIIRCRGEDIPFCESIN